MPPFWSVPALSDLVRPIKTTTLSDTWCLLQRHEFEIRRSDGHWQHQVRETYDRGDGAAVLLCDLADKSVVVIRQFRYPAFYRGEDPFLIEACAGKLEGDDAETCARKEAVEETGYTVGRLVKAFDCYMSPGSVTERLTLFLGFIDGAADGNGGGIADEHNAVDSKARRFVLRQAVDSRVDRPVEPHVGCRFLLRSQCALAFLLT